MSVLEFELKTSKTSPTTSTSTNYFELFNKYSSDSYERMLLLNDTVPLKTCLKNIKSTFSSEILFLERLLSNPPETNDFKDYLLIENDPIFLSSVKVYSIITFTLSLIDNFFTLNSDIENIKNSILDELLFWVAEQKYFSNLIALYQRKTKLLNIRIDNISALVDNRIQCFESIHLKLDKLELKLYNLFFNYTKFQNKQYKEFDKSELLTLIELKNTLIEINEYFLNISNSSIYIFQEINNLLSVAYLFSKTNYFFKLFNILKSKVNFTLTEYSINIINSSYSKMFKDKEFELNLDAIKKLLIKINSFSQNSKILCTQLKKSWFSNFSHINALEKFLTSSSRYLSKHSVLIRENSTQKNIFFRISSEECLSFSKNILKSISSYVYTSKTKLNLILSLIFE